MKLLLLGSKGRIGYSLKRSLATLGDVVALDRHGIKGLCGDLSNLEGIATTIRSTRPDVVVNAAAYTAVDTADSEIEKAITVNSTALEVIATEVLELDALLIHYSTSYVFGNNSTRPWKENDLTYPLNAYGRTKLAGEEAIKRSRCRYLIFRTSWVHSAYGKNFWKTVIRLAGITSHLKVINNQFSTPTSADLIADVTTRVIGTANKSKHNNTYHLVSAGKTSLYDYAKFVTSCACNLGILIRHRPLIIQPIPSCKFPNIAKRPLNACLSNNKLQSAFDIKLPPWQTEVRWVLSKIPRQGSLEYL